MTVTHAKPLTPENCDLRAVPHLPLDVHRLMDADFTATTSGEAFKTAVLLWCASWHQVPAASLPDDDRALCDLLGISVVAWRSVRKEALYGYIKCSDGRLYHPVVAEMALRVFADLNKITPPA